VAQGVAGTRAVRRPHCDRFLLDVEGRVADRALEERCRIDAPSAGCSLLSAAVAIAVAIGLGIHVSGVSGAKEGQFTVQIVKKEDVPDQDVPGLPVTLDQKLRNQVLERRTDASGRASFDVDPTDIFAVRIRKSAEPHAPVFVLASDAQVDAQTKHDFKLVRLADIPEESWIKRTSPSPGAAAADQRFAQLPPAFFRWRDSGRAQDVINVDSEREAFPFRLPGAETIIRRTAFTVGFSPLLKLPRWVAYRIAPGKSLVRMRDHWVPILRCRPHTRHRPPTMLVTNSTAVTWFAAKMSSASGDRASERFST
jgi:hypothetical protein